MISAAPADAPPPPLWANIELAVRVAVKNGSADLIGSVHMPLLTAIEAPPGSVLICDGDRIDLADAFVGRPIPPSSDVVRDFIETLTPAQVEAMPGFLDWLHYDDVTIELPDGCGLETVVVRGLNQFRPGAPIVSVYPQYRYC
jgi:hypothetical protein